MERLGMLIGIGMMMVGVCDIALSIEIDWFGLIPAIAGGMIGTASVAAVHSEYCRKPLASINAMAAVLIILFCVVKFGEDAAKACQGSYVWLSDVELFVLALTLIAVWIASCLEKQFRWVSCQRDGPIP